MPSIPNRLTVRGTQVAYLEQGSGQPVILLHCSANSGAQWRWLVDALSDRFRVMAPDLYGYGATGPWPGRVPFALEHEAEIVLALLGRLDEPAHLIGHSYGGAIALHVARMRSDLLQSLTLIEPVAFHLLRHGGALDALAFSEISEVAAKVAASLGCGDYSGGFWGFVDYWSGPGAWFAVPEQKREAMAARLHKVALDFHATLNDPARLEDFRTMTLPTLALQGSCSPLPTRRICERLAGALPELAVEVIEGAGHMLPLTHRDPVNRLVAAHLNATASYPLMQIGKGESHASHAIQ